MEIAAAKRTASTPATAGNNAHTIHRSRVFDHKISAIRNQQRVKGEDCFNRQCQLFRGVIVFLQFADRLGNQTTQFRNIVCRRQSNWKRRHAKKAHSASFILKFWRRLVCHANQELRLGLAGSWLRYRSGLRLCRFRGSRGGLLRCFRHGRFLTRSEDGMQRRALHARHEFHDADVAHVLDQAIDDVVTKVAMGHLAAFETQRSLDLITLMQKADGLVFLGLIIVFIHGYRKLYFLDDDDFLLLTRRTIALVFFVEKFSIILNTADGRYRVRRHFHEIQPAFAGNLQCFEWLQDAELITFVVDDANFAGANLIVDANK